MDAWLTVEPGTARERKVQVRGRLTIGRACDGVPEDERVILGDSEVSRSHLEIRLDPRGRAVAVDTSTNGTRVNGMRIERGRAHPLSPGDAIRVGSTELRFDAFGTIVPADESGATRANLVMEPMVLVVGDVIGYSTISELTASESMARALDELFSRLRELLHRHWGTVADYVGDAFFAIWSPSADPEANERAVAFAREAAIEVERLAPTLDLPRPDGTPLRMGWSVTAGEVTVGALGGGHATVVGDPVNVAFRIASLAGRDERATILVADRVRAAAPGDYEWGERDEILVKGRTGPVLVHGLEPRPTGAQKRRGPG